MTRKRFVKLCMGLGYSRNEANAMAARARRYGLRIHHSFVDELTESGPALTQEQIDATTAKWPGGTAALVGIDLADGPDVAAQIHVAGGADNAD